MQTSDSFWRDANRIPIQGHGLVAIKSVTFVGDGETAVIPLFSVTGVVELLKLWGVVTTAFENHTAAHWRVNDQTAADQVITKATGTDLSDISAGALIIANVLAATALTYKTADAGSLLQPAVVNSQIWSPSVIVQKTGSIETDIEYVYTTTDSPTSGVMQFFAGYLPLSEGGKLTVL